MGKGEQLPEHAPCTREGEFWAIIQPRLVGLMVCITDICIRLRCLPRLISVHLHHFADPIRLCNLAPLPEHSYSVREATAALTESRYPPDTAPHRLCDHPQSSNGRQQNLPLHPRTGHHQTVCHLQCTRSTPFLNALASPYVQLPNCVAQIADRLCASIGQDILDCLFSRSTLEVISHHKRPTSYIFRPVAYFALALVYNGESQGSFMLLWTDRTT